MRLPTDERRQRTVETIKARETNSHGLSFQLGGAQESPEQWASAVVKHHHPVIPRK